MTERIEAFGILEIEHRLGLAVAPLLAVVGFHGVAAEMPDEGRGTIAKREARVEHPPANIDVVTGGGELGIEAINLREGGFAEEHIAAGQMLGAIVAGEDMGGRAG